MKHKPYTTIDEQIILLKQKGLSFKDEEVAHKVLTEIGYYRLSGYTLSLRNKHDCFYPGVSFDDVMEIYNMDKEMRLLILSYLEDIEVALRSHISYILGRQEADADSPTAYLQQSNYLSEQAFLDISSEIGPAVNNNKNEAFIKHHKTKYSGIIPTWVMMEVLSFGQASSHSAVFSYHSLMT